MDFSLGKKLWLNFPLILVMTLSLTGINPAFCQDPPSPKYSKSGVKQLKDEYEKAEKAAKEAENTSQRYWVKKVNAKFKAQELMKQVHSSLEKSASDTPDLPGTEVITPEMTQTNLYAAKQELKHHVAKQARDAALQARDHAKAAYEYAATDRQLAQAIQKKQEQVSKAQNKLTQAESRVALLKQKHKETREKIKWDKNPTYKDFDRENEAYQAYFYPQMEIPVLERKLRNLKSELAHLDWLYSSNQAPEIMQSQTGQDDSADDQINQSSQRSIALKSDYRGSEIQRPNSPANSRRSSLADDAKSQ